MPRLQRLFPQLFFLKGFAVLPHLQAIASTPQRLNPASRQTQPRERLVLLWKVCKNNETTKIFKTCYTHMKTES